MKTHRLLGFFAVFLLAANAWADAQVVTARWTGSEDADAGLEHVLTVLSAKAGFAVAATDLRQQDDRDLAYTHYTRFAQMAAGMPVAGKGLRLWKDRATGALVQAEATLEKPEATEEAIASLRRSGRKVADLRADLTSADTARLARAAITEDRALKSLTTEDLWVDGRAVRRVTAKARRGTHTVDIDLLRRAVSRHDYAEYPQHGGFSGALPKQADADDGITLQANLFPMYEQVEGSDQILGTEPAELRYINRQVQRGDGDLYEALRDRRYMESQYDAVLGDTALGQLMGFWSMNWVRSRAEAVRAALPYSENSFTGGGLLLSGRYATINIHAAAVDRFGASLGFTPGYSTQFRPDWRESLIDGEYAWEMVPSGARLGRPLASAEEALTRPARRTADHDPVGYINDGFDELQVYYAVNQMFDALRPMGFTDPDLAERPFHAFLFDPDISMRDNAYYTDDTINFTTYSPGQANMARDNPTIWHELGHGVMDRLMGPALQLADTGGLSEGMADFVALLVTEAVTGGAEFPGKRAFRIMNRTGFFLTNEVHDDGEAYGGAMGDILANAVARFGHADGLRKVTDVVLEAMRLCRDNPGLTAQDWFNHMLFADSLGRPGVRGVGELRELILSSLAGRNFSLDTTDAANLAIQNVTMGIELGSRGPGSRPSPIPVELTPEAESLFNLEARVTGASHYQFRFPVTVKVSLNGGPLQGAIRWMTEASYPKTVVLQSEADAAQLLLGATGVCDAVNRDDGSCVDFAYIQLFNAGDDLPVAKKRFYLRVKPISPQ